MTSGLIILDKPSGPTSFDCVEGVGRIFGIKKAGHTGTLDPKVTGVLLILLGETRKLAPLFEKLDKIYVGVMHLHNEVPLKKLEECVKKYTGVITQLPPVKSRVKRVERKRKIHRFEIQKVEGNDITLLIDCEHGTYIRKLFHDMGEELGCGAHMKHLRRIGVSVFREEEVVSYDDLKEGKEKYIIPNEKIIERLKIKTISVSKEEGSKVENGVPIQIEDKNDFVQGERVAIFIEDKLRAIGTVEEERIKINRLLNV
ncbi:MAG: RNA-guided pseudouridylation complex pseudouridine synthase subunit Cbf5 [Candidatus Aenigmatarchaeota archaeon]|nr:MAG: RNA-guided pseudouridylation complex pseudouridine synthase subunit Cbf5 [Candidatus Aenigmarchaeota archaeon]